MSRELLRTIVTTLLIIGMLLCLHPSSVLAAPPLPTAVPPSPPIPPSQPPSPYGYRLFHVVQYGENLTRIAARYGTTVWAIAQANGIWDINRIYCWQVLLIPLYAPAPPLVPRVYIVQPSDTLMAIAWRFGTTVRAIAQANGIWNPNLIYVGQVLYIH